MDTSSGRLTTQARDQSDTTTTTDTPFAPIPSSASTTPPATATAGRIDPTRAALRIGTIIQARMSSKRLPGKVLRPIHGKPMLGYLLDRLAHSSSATTLVVCTSIDPSDHAIADYCQAMGVTCYRGDLDNVASRFLGAAQTFGFDAFARINGDSPLLDPRLLDHATALYRTRDLDLVTNAFPRTFPPGQSVEVVRTATFADAVTRMDEPADFEHVTHFLYRHSERYRIENFASVSTYRDIHLAVDTVDDLLRMTQLLAQLGERASTCTLDDIVGLYRLAA